jgi:hypothetical protein
MKVKPIVTTLAILTVFLVLGCQSNSDYEINTSVPLATADGTGNHSSWDEAGRIHNQGMDYILSYCRRPECVPIYAVNFIRIHTSYDLASAQAGIEAANPRPTLKSTLADLGQLKSYRWISEREYALTKRLVIAVFESTSDEAWADSIAIIRDVVISTDWRSNEQFCQTVAAIAVHSLQFQCNQCNLPRNNLDDWDWGRFGASDVAGAVGGAIGGGIVGGGAGIIPGAVGGGIGNSAVDACMQWLGY